MTYDVPILGLSGVSQLTSLSTFPSNWAIQGDTLTYEDAALGLAFTATPAPPAKGLRNRFRAAPDMQAALPVGRPDYIGEAALVALSTFASWVGLPERLPYEETLAGWREANLAARHVLSELELQRGWTSTDAEMNDWYRWTSFLDLTRRQLEDEAFVPQQMLLVRIDEPGTQALRVMTWTEGQAQAMPQVGHALLTMDGTRRLLGMDVVREALADVLEPLDLYDGAVRGHIVPVEHDSECRRRIAEIVASREWPEVTPGAWGIVPPSDIYVPAT